ncbi:hypothetical protein M409DRAFT_64771 [Zasmidium cellare ATCC 36951]|uniref:Uncharacterized protein n=1 Tax=Zasmidium cellare ATCC 36951 TaxID=1080233 RepID=A0A6A6CRF9_ZASCE|nr:uncharacterized protein M409DRAFT_64771 [Zasmidium cellare ATCC 36951]KAF2169744.1 hypothetical protein M409DRAFT_64771 [Zasmidium cellare ATCC 36951]
MSAAALREHGGISPTGSGRSSPVPRAARRTVEDGLYKADKTLKRYAATIERALASWEISPEEWADYIAFLARLLKAIQTHPKDAPFLPHSSSIATRLAQCLNPALPSGVHQKSLEVYTYIFSTFGNDYISGHLHEFLPGLSAVLSFASLSVRPALYDLLESHVVSLSPVQLRPALKSLILGLLPALEEETAEDFERAFKILRILESTFVPDSNSINLALDPDGYFWQCLFLAVITNPSRRQGALNFLVQRLPPLGPTSGETDGGNKRLELSKAAECVVSPEPGLLVRCFVCGLSDSQILIQRGFLDLLVSHLPLNSPVLQQLVGPSDLDRLVSAAILVLLRRDMSLNRRLWSWFLGPEPKEQATNSQPSSPVLQRTSSGDSEPSVQLRYFSKFGQNSLQRCILKMLQEPAQVPWQKARPYRICLSLMDRWEIGGLLVPKVFLPAMKDLHAYSTVAESADTAEVVRSASLFFDGVEASLIWRCLIGTLHETVQRGQPALPALDLFNWIISTFNVKDEEMLTVHIPQAMAYLMSCLDSMDLEAGARSKVVSTLLALLEFVPGRIFQTGSTASKAQTETQLQMSAESVRAAVMNFYRQTSHGNKETTVLTGWQVVALLTSKTTQQLSRALEDLNAELFAQLTTLLLALRSKTAENALPVDEDVGMALAATFKSEQESIIPFSILQSIIALESSSTNRKIEGKGYSRTALAHIESEVTSQLWYYLSPEQPKYHVEAVKTFWQLDGLIFPSDAVTSSLIGLSRSMPGCAESGVTRAETARRFTILWDHSISTGITKAGAGRRGSAMSVLQDSKQMARSQQVLEEPLLLTLDALNDPTDPAFEVVKSWLQGLSSLEQVLQILFKHTLELSSAIKKQSTDSVRNCRERVLKLDYILGHLQHIVEHGNLWTRRTLGRITIFQEGRPDGTEGLLLLADTCVALLCSDFHASKALNRRLIFILELLLSGPNAAELKQLDLDSTLLDQLMVCIGGEMESLQGGILRLAQLALKLRLVQPPTDHAADNRQRGSISSKRPSIAPSMRPNSSASSLTLAPSPPHQLFRCLRMGFSSNRTRFYLDQWLAFLGDILPSFADALFTNLLPLVECFCEQLAKVHEEIEQLSRRSPTVNAVTPESVAMSLLEGLEMVLDRAYECLLTENAPEPTPKDSDNKTNFLTNVASGVFKAEGPPSRTSKSNSRLTVILALQDSIRAALRMWLWASNPTDVSDFDSTNASTTAYVALRKRNKTRHLLEQIFSVEPLESLEVVISHWSNASSEGEASTALSLLHVMSVSRPKNVVPATLDALCSRTNPSAIPPARNSSLTIDLSASDTATFLSAYLDSTEDDAIDELWPDCVAFLRDVLANPLPYRQVLPHFLSIILLLAEKLNNTNFGEQRKMRRDLGDIFQRLLTATFTTLPSGYVADLAANGALQNGTLKSRRATVEHDMGLVEVLKRVMFKLDIILETQERMAYAINNITQSLLSPMFKSKAFPQNISMDALALVVQMTRKAPGAKPWKKEIADAFNDPKLLASAMSLMSEGWFPVLHQWSLHDKERMPELLSRLTPPASAGIMFGVGASAARLEADRRTQLNLRRLCVLLLASPEDTYVAHLRTIEEKISELFEASPSSSPSAAIKAELFMLCRTLTLSVSSVHMSPFWPIINDKLEAALTSLLPSSSNSNDFNNLSILQACKLLDLLVSLSPDEFQLHEWLYITDTIDAVYQPSDFSPVALSDQIAETLGSASVDNNMLVTPTTPGGGGKGKRRQLLGEDLAVDKGDIQALPKEEFVRAVIRPFLSQLSMHSYEGVYSLEQTDGMVLRESLLADLLDLGSVVE